MTTPRSSRANLSLQGVYAVRRAEDVDLNPYVEEQISIGSTAGHRIQCG
jgi:hypothetical protein